MTDDKPRPDDIQDGKVPPAPELEDASHGDTDDIALPTPLEPGDAAAQPI